MLGWPVWAPTSCLRAFINACQVTKLALKNRKSGSHCLSQPVETGSGTNWNLQNMNSTTAPLPSGRWFNSILRHYWGETWNWKQNARHQDSPHKCTLETCWVFCACSHGTRIMSSNPSGAGFAAAWFRKASKPASKEGHGLGWSLPDMAQAGTCKGTCLSTASLVTYMWMVSQSWISMDKPSKYIELISAQVPRSGFRLGQECDTYC